MLRQFFSDQISTRGSIEQTEFNYVQRGCLHMNSDPMSSLHKPLIVVCRFHEGTSHVDSRAVLSFIANHTGPEDRSKKHVSTPSGQWLQKKRPAATFQWLQWGGGGYHSKLSYYLSLNLFTFVGRKFASWTLKDVWLQILQIQNFNNAEVLYQPFRCCS